MERNEGLEKYNNAQQEAAIESKRKEIEKQKAEEATGCRRAWDVEEGEWNQGHPGQAHQGQDVHPRGFGGGSGGGAVKEDAYSPASLNVSESEREWVGTIVSHGTLKPRLISLVFYTVLLMSSDCNLNSESFYFETGRKKGSYWLKINSDSNLNSETVFRCKTGRKNGSYWLSIAQLKLRIVVKSSFYLV